MKKTDDRHLNYWFYINYLLSKLLLITFKNSKPQTQIDMNPKIVKVFKTANIDVDPASELSIVKLSFFLIIRFLLSEMSI